MSQTTNATQTKETLLNLANEMYTKLKEIVKVDNDFTKLPDKKKLDYFRTTLGYNEFMNEFPIVARYMICMGQFSKKAFSRFLEKIRSTVHPPADKREKGYMEDQWIRRQADYVRYLWEAYQKGHYNNAEAKWVWEDSYKKLKGEFDDFRDKYKSIEKTTKEEKQQLKGALAKDLIQRLATAKQTVSKAEAERLLSVARELLVKRRFKNVLYELIGRGILLEANTAACGRGQRESTTEDEAPDSSKPVIRMVETVDADRINDVPAEYRMDKSLETINEEDE